MAGLNALHQVVVLAGRHSVDDVDAGLVYGQYVGRGKDAYIGRHNRLGCHTLTVARHRHVAHHIHIRYVLTEIVDARLGRLGHTFHKFFFLDVPLVGLTGGGVYPGLADAAVGTAYADVLVAAAETALGVPLEVGQRHHRVVVLQMTAHRHLGKPFAADDGQFCSAFLVEYVDRAEGPAVHLQGLTVLGGGVAVAGVIGVGLYHCGVGQVFLQKGFHPLAGDDVGTVGLAGVKLHTHTAFYLSAHLLVGLDKTLSAQVAGEVYHRLVAGALFIAYVFVAVGHSLVLGCCHTECHNA